MNPPPIKIPDFINNDPRDRDIFLTGYHCAIVAANTAVGIVHDEARDKDDLCVRASLAFTALCANAYKTMSKPPEIKPNV